MFATCIIIYFLIYIHAFILFNITEHCLQVLANEIYNETIQVEHYTHCS